MSASSHSRTSDLDPDIQVFVQSVKARSAELTDGGSVSLAERREMAHVETLHLADGEVRIRIFSPEHMQAQGVLLCLHGGGWTLFSIEPHDRIMREYADRASCTIVGLDYSLAPEYRFPRALNDVILCADWLRTNEVSHALETAKIISAAIQLAGTWHLRKCYGMPV